MSLSTKVKMSPLEGTRNGQTTRNERQRTQSVRSDAKVIPEAVESKRSGNDPELECTPNQALAEDVSSKGSRGLGLQASWTPRESPFVRRGEEESLEFVEDQIPRLWSHPGP